MQNRKFIKHRLGIKHRFVTYILISIQIRQDLKWRKLKEGESTRNILGCSRKCFIEWIFYQLDLDSPKLLKLGNHGKFWHSHHQIPGSSFNRIHNDE